MRKRRSISVLLFILILDLMGFSLIFPLVPDLLSFYVGSDYHSLDRYLPHFLDWLLQVAPAIGNSEERDIILLGGVLAALYSLLQFACSPFWGRLSDRLGRRPVLLLTSLGLALGYLIWGASSTFTMFLVSRVVAGMMAGNLGVATAAMADISTQEGRTKSMGLVGAAFGVGFIVGPALGGALSKVVISSDSLHLNPFAAAAFASMALSLLSATLNFFYLQETLPTELRQKTKFRFEHPFQALKKLDQPLFRRMLLLNFVFMFLFTSFEFTMTFFYKIDFGLSPARIGIIFVYLGVLLAFGQGYLVRRLSAVWSEKTMILWGIVLLAIGLPFLALSSPSVPWSLVALAPVSIGSSLMQPSMTGLASRLVSADIQGLAMSTFRSMGSLARGVGPVFGAYIYGSMGITFTYFTLSVLLILSFLAGLVTLVAAQRQVKAKAE